MGAGRERFAFTFYASKTSSSYVLNAIGEYNIEGSVSN